MVPVILVTTMGVCDNNSAEKIISNPDRKILNILVVLPLYPKIKQQPKQSNFIFYGSPA